MVIENTHGLRSDTETPATSDAVTSAGLHRFETNPNELAAVPKELFERVWEFVKACEEREKNFNSLQSDYRTLASTWLLAAFGGIGFVISTNLNAPLSWTLLVSGIAAAGAIGLVLLWILDVMVYHELLVIGYTAGKQLEKQFAWLPPVRSHFGKTREPFAARHFIAMYYCGGIVGLSSVAVVILLSSGRGTLMLLLLPVLTGTVVPFFVWLITKKALAWSETLPVWMRSTSGKAPNTV